MSSSMCQRRSQAMHYRTEMHEERRRTIKTLLRRRKTGLGQQRHLELLDTGEERGQEQEMGENLCQEHWPVNNWRQRKTGAGSRGTTLLLAEMCFLCQI